MFCLIIILVLALKTFYNVRIQRQVSLASTFRTGRLNISIDCAVILGGLCTLQTVPVLIFHCHFGCLQSIKSEFCTFMYRNYTYLTARIKYKAFLLQCFFCYICYLVLKPSVVRPHNWIYICFKTCVLCPAYKYFN